VVNFSTKKTYELQGSKRLNKAELRKQNYKEGNSTPTKMIKHDMDTNKIAMELKETSSCFV